MRQPRQDLAVQVVPLAGVEMMRRQIPAAVAAMVAAVCIGCSATPESVNAAAGGDPPTKFTGARTVRLNANPKAFLIEDPPCVERDFSHMTSRERG